MKKRLLYLDAILGLPFTGILFVSSWVPALGIFVGLSMLEMLAISVGAATLIYLASQGKIEVLEKSI